MTDISGLGLGDDTAAAHTLIHKARVAAVPGSSFYSRPELGTSKLRFSYSKTLSLLKEKSNLIPDHISFITSR